MHWVVTLSSHMAGWQAVQAMGSCSRPWQQGSGMSITRQHRPIYATDWYIYAVALSMSMSMSAGPEVRQHGNLTKASDLFGEPGAGG